MSSAADRRGLVVAVAYLVAALHGLGASDIVGDDEAREAGIVQEIVHGDVLLPRFNGESIPDKPILYHWLAAVPCAVAGFSETAVRLPSAVAGAALVGWTARIGTELLGAPAGLVAAALLATTPSLFDRARVARPDALLVLLLSVALGLAFRWWRDGSRTAATAALAALGAATLAKGPVAPTLFALTLGGFLAWQGELRRVRELATAPGLAALLVLGLGWYALALAGWGRDFVHEHLAGRYLFNLLGDVPGGGAYSKHGVPFHLLFYPEHLLAIALPWTPFAALAVWQAARADGLRDPRARFLLCWALAPVVAFTPAQWKLRHYLLPALPAMALLAAPAVVALARVGTRRLARRDVVTVAAVAVVAGLAAGAVLGGRVSLSASDRTLVEALATAVAGREPLVALAVAVAAGALAAAALRRSWRVVVGVVATGVVTWMVGGAPRLETAISRRDSLRPFAARVAALYPPPAPLAFYPEPMRAVAVYVGRRVPTVRRSADIAPGLALVTTAEGEERLARAGRVGPVLATAEGRAGNLARTRVVLVEGRTTTAQAP